MEIRYILIFCLFLGNNLFGQESKGLYRVKNGTDISKSIPFSERFLFSEFKDGHVYFKNGRIVKAKLNYSLVHGEIQFIDPKKDTLLLNDNDYIDRIAIGNDIFYYVEKQGHIQQIVVYDKVKLAQKQFLVSMGSEKYAAYDQYSATSAISSYSSFSNGTGALQFLDGNDKIVMKKRSVYFLIDKNQRFLLANRGNLVRLFPNHKRALNDYIKEKNLDLEKVENLKIAMEYVSSL